jgi:hypothetical protein
MCMSSDDHTTFFVSHFTVRSYARGSLCCWLTLLLLKKNIFNPSSNSYHFQLIIIPANIIMSACYEEALCKDNSLPLDGRHSCGTCDSELHGICGCFYNEDSIKRQNIGMKCKIALDRKNHELTIHGLPPLPFPLMPQEVVQLVPEIRKWL